MIRAYDDWGNVVDLVEHDKKVRADVIDDYTDWLRKTHANFDEDYAEDIKSDYLEQLKEQKDEKKNIS